MNADNQYQSLNQYLGKALSHYLILSVLKMDGKHSGYSLIQRIKKLSSGRITVRAGTIYPQIEKLVNNEYIIKSIEEVKQQTTDQSRQIAMYVITTKGIEQLHTMYNDWSELKSIVDQFIP